MTMKKNKSQYVLLQLLYAMRKKASRTF